MLFCQFNLLNLQSRTSGYRLTSRKRGILVNDKKIMKLKDGKYKRYKATF